VYCPALKAIFHSSLRCAASARELATTWVIAAIAGPNASTSAKANVVDIVVSSASPFARGIKIGKASPITGKIENTQNAVGAWTTSRMPPVTAMPISSPSPALMTAAT
jgi:hypothetical protein